MSLEGKTAFVTGGGRGIGAACARALAQSGMRVAVVARTRDQVDAVAREIEAAGGTSLAIAADVTQADAVREAARLATARFGPVDVLVNNAGTAFSAPFVKTSLEEWNRMFAVNATSAFLCTKELLPEMTARGWGRVVNVASVAARSGARYIAAYAAAKHALLGLTRCVAAEVAAHGVTVNAVCPGYAETDMTRETVRRIVEKTGLREDEALARIVEHSPQKRLLTPEEIAAVVCALCADDARAINGQAIVVDGGELLA